VNPITIGDNVSICDRAMIHCSGGGSLDSPTKIGNRVHIGVGATVHGAILEDECRIGDMATILDHAVVQKHAIVAAGAVVSPKTIVPSGQLWSGIPARYERDLTLDEISQIGYMLSDTADLAYVHAEEQIKPWEQIVEEAETLEENQNRNPHYCQVTPEKVCFFPPSLVFTHTCRSRNITKMKQLKDTPFLVDYSILIVSLPSFILLPISLIALFQLLHLVKIDVVVSMNRMRLIEQRY
jgi:carbonic anhydrase/acetyltransferase-like protein (isoleucine patch superfamily)